MAWRFDPIEIGLFLEGEGFDLEPGSAHFRPQAGNVSGRRIRGDRAVGIAIDAGGRVRVTVTTRSEGARRAVRVATGLTLTGIAVDIREETLSGRLQDGDDLRAIVEALL